MAQQHPRYHFKHTGSGASSHELRLQPRADSDYGLRTTSVQPEGDDCLVRDPEGNVIHWVHDVGHKDWVTFHYPFKVLVEASDGHVESLIHYDGEEQLRALPVALGLHEDLEIRLSSMLYEANSIIEETETLDHHTRQAVQTEVEEAMAEDFDDEAIEEMTSGTFFRYFVATHETKGGIRVLLKFMHLVNYDEDGRADSFCLKFRSAKILVPYGPEFERFFRHEHSLGSLVVQNNIMHSCVNGAYQIASEIQDHRRRSDEVEDGDEIEQDGATSVRGEERIQGVVSSLKKAGKSVGSAFSKAGKKVGKVASSAGKAVVRRTASVARSAGRGVARGARAAGRVASSAATRVKTAATSAAGRVRSGVSSVYNKAKTGVTALGTKVKTGVSDLGTKVKTGLSNAKQSVKTGFTTVKDKVKAKATDAKEAVGRKYKDVKTAVSGARDKIRDKYTDVKQSVRDKVDKLRGKSTGSSSVKPKSSTNAPQDKVSPSTSGDSVQAAGTASPGDPRAPQGSGKSDQLKKQLPLTPQEKTIADGAKDKTVFDNKGAAPKPPGKNEPKTKPRRFGEDASKPSVSAPAKADDGLSRYNTPAPSSSSSSASTGGAQVTVTSTNNNGATSSTTVTTGGSSAAFPKEKAPAPPAAVPASGSKVATTTTASGATKVSATRTNADGTTKTVTTKMRADGTTKTTSTKTAADGTVISNKTKGDTKNQTQAESKTEKKKEKEPKEKKPGLLSKLKDKVSSSSSPSAPSGDNSGGGGGGGGGAAVASGGDGGGFVPSADMSDTRPDYSQIARNEQARQVELERQNNLGTDLQPFQFGAAPRDRNDGRDIAGAVVAGAVTGAVLGSAVSQPAPYYGQPQVPPPMYGGAPGGIYGAPAMQNLPPGYAVVGNVVMAAGPDGRFYPLTPDQTAYLQFYQQRQLGLVAPNAVAPPQVATQMKQQAEEAPQEAEETQPAKPASYVPSRSIRLADDDELVGGASAKKAASTASTKTKDDLINDQLSEAEDAERRDALLKYMLAEHASTFGKTPNKLQKDKLKTRLAAVKPFVIKKIFAAYVEWLVNDTGLRYAVASSSAA